MISAEQKETRRKYIGSSDSAAIMGIDPYRSAADVWAEKCGMVEDWEGNDATDAGTLLEPSILAWAETQLGIIVRDVLRIHPDGFTCANLDGFVFATGELVEAKSTGIVGYPDAGYGEPGTDELPDRVIAQVHHQFAHHDTGVAWVPVLIGQRGFVKYRVDRNEKLVTHILESGQAFMRDHVRTGIRPDDFRPSLETLKRWRRTPNKVISVPDTLVDGVIIARAAAKQAKEDVEIAERELLTALGDAEGGDVGDGRSVTYMETARRGYSVEPTTYRTLRVKGKVQRIEQAALAAT